jgi:hypothetical protein
MSKTYLVITSFSGSEVASAFGSYDEAADYINETTDEWGDNVTEIRKMSTDNYKVSFHNNVYLIVEIKAFDSTTVKFIWQNMTTKSM